MTDKVRIKGVPRANAASAPAAGEDIELAIDPFGSIYAHVVGSSSGLPVEFNFRNLNEFPLTDVALGDVQVTAAEMLFQTLTDNERVQGDTGTNMASKAFPTLSAPISWSGNFTFDLGNNVMRYVESVNVSNPALGRVTIDPVQNHQPLSIGLNHTYDLNLNEWVVPAVQYTNRVTSPTAAFTDVASAQLISANTLRRFLLIVNTSTATVWINFGEAAVVDASIPLLAGEKLSFTGTVLGDAVNAIGATGNSGNVFIISADY